jgi:hypothetical protein
MLLVKEIEAVGACGRWTMHDVRKKSLMDDSHARPRVD